MGHKKTYNVSIQKTFTIRRVCSGPGARVRVRHTGQNATERIRSHTETGVPMALRPPTGDLFGKTAGLPEALEEAVN